MLTPVWVHAKRLKSLRMLRFGGRINYLYTPIMRYLPDSSQLVRHACAQRVQKIYTPRVWRPQTETRLPRRSWFHPHVFYDFFRPLV